MYYVISEVATTTLDRVILFISLYFLLSLVEMLTAISKSQTDMKLIPLPVADCEATPLVLHPSKSTPLVLYPSKPTASSETHIIRPVLSTSDFSHPHFSQPLQLNQQVLVSEANSERVGETSVVTGSSKPAGDVSSAGSASADVTQHRVTLHLPRATVQIPSTAASSLLAACWPETTTAFQVQRAVTGSSGSITTTASGSRPVAVTSGQL